MCGRFAQAISPVALARFFALESVPAVGLDRYNIAPTQKAWTVRLDSGGRRRLTAVRWGLIPHWAKDASIGNRLFNARSETLRTKPAFREALGRRRCLVPVSGFYEWQQPQRGDASSRAKKIPHYLSDSRQPLGLAGLWERWRGDDGQPLDTFTIITCEAPDQLRWLHHRVPLIVAPENYLAWLGRETSPERVDDILKESYPEELMVRPVGEAVNDASCDDARCIAERDAT
jgi:putative SOS response-associated peptidase YedK